MIGVFGANGNQKILATGWFPLYIEEDSYTGEEPSNLPTPTQWDLYITEINNLLSACQATVIECTDILNQLETDYNTYIQEFNQIKSDTEDYKDEANEILDNVQQVKQDIIDMGSARTFATFYLDPTTGGLYVVNAESLGNMNFFIQDGKLYVQMRTEIN